MNKQAADKAEPSPSSYVRNLFSADTDDFKSLYYINSSCSLCAIVLRRIHAQTHTASLVPCSIGMSGQTAGAASAVPSNNAHALTDSRTIVSVPRPVCQTGTSDCSALRRKNIQRNGLPFVRSELNNASCSRAAPVGEPKCPCAAT